MTQSKMEKAQAQLNDYLSYADLGFDMMCGVPLAHYRKDYSHFLAAVEAHVDSGKVDNAVLVSPEFDYNTDDMDGVDFLFVDMGDVQADTVSDISKISADITSGAAKPKLIVFIWDQYIPC